MNLSKLEHYLDRCEKLLFFDQYKAEAERLGPELNMERINHADDVRRRDAEIAEYKGLRLRYAGESYSLEQFDALVERRVQEFREKELASAVEKRWIAESPAFLDKRLRVEYKNYPDRCSPELKSLVDSLATRRANEILKNPDMWPPWFRQTYQNEFGKSLLNMGLGIYALLTQ